MSKSLGPGTAAAVVYTLAAWMILVGAFEAFARHFESSSPELRREGAVFENAALDVLRTRAELTPPEAPRIAVHGSSQIRVVKNSDGDAPAIPRRLQSELSERGERVEVVDLSLPGGQVMESLVVHLSTEDVVQPSLVVLGVGFFSMQRMQVRETLLADVDAAAIRNRILELGEGLEPAQREGLLTFTRQAAERVQGQGETIQQRLDRRVAAALGEQLAFVSKRQVLFDNLLDRPVRRDLVAWFKRSFTRQRTARTYGIGKAYPDELAAIEVMARDLEGRGVPLLVVVLPFDDSRTPVPYEPQAMERLREDLASRATRLHYRILDLSHLLDPSHYGYLADGSPDGLHFDASGHALVAERIADVAARLLEENAR